MTRIENFIEKNIASIVLFIILAYMFSMGIRMYWPMHFSDNASMMYSGELMINTNDGYIFATAARDYINGVTAEDYQRAAGIRFSPGLVLLTAYITKLTPFSLETVILYLPAVISSLIVIPIILTSRLFGNTIVGFLAALLGSITWSYYNRTMVGYYDTDMFSVLFQATILYTFLAVIYTKSVKSIIVAAVFLFIYPYFYSQGITLVFAMFILLVLYLIGEARNIFKEKNTRTFQESHLSLYASVILLSIPLMISLPIWLRLILFIITMIMLLKIKLNNKTYIYIAVASFIGFLVFGNIFNIFISYLSAYLDRGVEQEGLHFYQVIQTVREAGAIPFSTMANRISGSQIGVIISLVGYIVLVVRHNPFIIALPLIGVGILSLWAGLRFTVYAVPVAALSSVYLFYVLSDMYLKNKVIKYVAIIVATVMMIYPNIKHIIGYKVPTVLNVTEVNDLVKLDKISTDKDYTLAWWDYGYPIWYYSNTNTLIDGGKHTNDNYIISTIMQSTSPELVANLSRLSVETYIDSNYSIVANTLFSNKKKDQTNPNILIEDLVNGMYPLPKKTRDIYIYLPYRMLNIFPTVAVFSNLDLNTGKSKRKMMFYPSRPISQNQNIITFQNGIKFDSKNGKVILGNQTQKVKYFVTTQNTNNTNIKLQTQQYHTDGEVMVVYMKSYGQFIIMDFKTFNSTYVQMFILGKYDKNLFELVVSSPYSKIYKVK